ncbi:MAG: outer membrane protein assembly factor BamA, partial [Candidatus Latescibacteria bacterium 4484_7]
MKIKSGLFLVLLLLVFSVKAYAYEVGTVKVSGNVFMSEEKVLSIFGIHPGDEYRPDKVTQGLKRLFDTKNFSDVSAYYKVVDGKIVLTVVVKEYPRVKSIKLMGNDKIKNDDIFSKMTIREGYFARPSMITSDIKAIKDLYADKGYNSTRIKVDRIPVKGEHMVSLVFKIDEGTKVKIKHIDFIGNTAIDSKKLRSVMETKEDRWWRGGELKPKKLEDDLKKIKKLYENLGYLDAGVSIFKKVAVNGAKGMDLYIKIDEGKQYRLGSIHWSGNKVIKDSRIEEAINMKPGEPYSLDKIEGIQVAINSMYWDKGYIWSRIIPVRRVKRNVIDLDLRIVENKPASIQEIKIAGNTKTFESVIRREFKVYPGDRFVLSEVQRSLRDVFSLGYFKGPPKVDTEPVNEEGDINLLIKVDEKQTGYFRMGAGFSQLNSLSGFLGISENNFLGRGKRISLDWEFGRWRRNLNFAYSEPYLMGTRTTLTLSVYNW